MALDVAHAHAARIHRHNLLVEARKPTLIASDQLGIERSFPVARNPNVELRRLGDHSLRRMAVAMVPAPLGGLLIQMIVQLGVENPLRQSLLQLVEQAILVENILRVAVRKKLVKRALADSHHRPPSASLWPRTQDS